MGVLDVTLRALSEEDLPMLYEHQADPQASAMAVFPPRDRDAFMEHWRTNVLGGASVVLRGIDCGGSLVGYVVSYVEQHERRVGYWIGREWWGKGIATEALRQYVAAVEDRPLFAYVAASNTGSVRVLEKCGFVLSREYTSQEISGGEPVDERVYVLGR